MHLDMSVCLPAGGAEGCSTAPECARRRPAAASCCRGSAGGQFRAPQRPEVRMQLRGTLRTAGHRATFRSRRGAAASTADKGSTAMVGDVSLRACLDELRDSNARRWRASTGLRCWGWDVADGGVESRKTPVAVPDCCPWGRRALARKPAHRGAKVHSGKTDDAGRCRDVSVGRTTGRSGGIAGGDHL